MTQRVIKTVSQEDIVATTYAIYERPKDYPDHYVLRRWVVTKSGLVLASPWPTCVSRTLEECQAAVPDGLVKVVPRNGDPTIIEEYI